MRFLTINAQKASANSPSLADLVTMVDTHSSDFLLLTKTPMHPTMEPYSTYSVIGSTEYTITRLTPRVSWTDFRRPASLHNSPTPVEAPWSPINGTPRGHPR